MRAFVVEFAGVDDVAVRGILEGRGLELTAGGAAAAQDGPGDESTPVATGAGAPATGVGANAETATEGEPL
jgi:hypothetical protein